MPSPQTESGSHRPRRRLPGDPFARLDSRKARWSRVIVITVSMLAILGILIAIPVVRAVAPAVAQAVANVAVRAFVRTPAQPAMPAKTTACTHIRTQAGPSHRHVCG